MIHGFRGVFLLRALASIAVPFQGPHKEQQWDSRDRDYLNKTRPHLINQIFISYLIFEPPANAKELMALKTFLPRESTSVGRGQSLGHLS